MHRSCMELIILMGPIALFITSLSAMRIWMLIENELTQLNIYRSNLLLLTTTTCKIEQSKFAIHVTNPQTEALLLNQNPPLGFACSFNNVLRFQSRHCKTTSCSRRMFGHRKPRSWLHLFNILISHSQCLDARGYFRTPYKFWMQLNSNCRNGPKQLWTGTSWSKIHCKV